MARTLRPQGPTRDRIPLFWAIKIKNEEEVDLSLTRQNKNDVKLLYLIQVTKKTLWEATPDTFRRRLIRREIPLEQQESMESKK